MFLSKTPQCSLLILLHHIEWNLDTSSLQYDSSRSLVPSLRYKHQTIASQPFLTISERALADSVKGPQDLAHANT